MTDFSPFETMYDLHYSLKGRHKCAFAIFMIILWCINSSALKYSRSFLFILLSQKVKNYNETLTQLSRR